jgi:hypothetical protein
MSPVSSSSRIDAPARELPDFVDSAIGMTTIIVVVLDSLLLIAMLARSVNTDVAEFSDRGFAIAFLASNLVLGIGAGFSIIARSLRDDSRLASRFLPLSLTWIRIGLMGATLPVLAIGWAGWDTGVFMMIYFVPTTFILLILSFASLVHSRHKL